MVFTVPLKKNHEFRRLYSKGKSSAAHRCVVYCRKNGQGVNRLGITVSTKVGNAVIRNRVRRRLKEIYRLNESSLLCGYDIVIVARVRAAEAAYAELRSDVLKLFKKLHITV